MAITMLIIKRPNIDKAKEYDEEYMQLIQSLDPDYHYERSDFIICEWEAYCF